MRPLDRWLLRSTGAMRWHLAASVGLGVVAAAAVIVQAGLLAHVIAATFLGTADVATLRGPLLALLVVVGVRALVTWAQEATATRAAARVKQELRTRLLDHVLDLGPGWLAGRRSGDLAQLATRGVDALDAYFAGYLPQFVLACVVPPLVVVRMGLADVLSAAVIVVTLPLVPVFMALVGWTTRRSMDRRWSDLRRLSHHFLDVLDGLPVLRAYGRGRAQAATVRRVTDDYRRSTLAVLRVSFLSSFVLELTASLSVALVAVEVGLRLLDGRVGLETALLVLILAPEAYLPLRRLGAGYHAAAEGLSAAAQVRDVLDEPAPLRGSTDVPHVAETGLSVENLQVRYPGRSRPALTGGTLRVGPGELVALVGPSGAGKSSLIAAVLGFVTPAAGRIQLGDVDLTDVDAAAWRQQVAWVPQRPRLVCASIADNVRLGVPDASDEEVLGALRAAAAEELDPALWLGEDGSGLSAGQRQRVALARALLRCTRGGGLLLLDEPTEHLDPATEERVLRTLAHRARDPERPLCVLLVGHRDAVARAADRVVRLATPGPLVIELGVPA